VRPPEDKSIKRWYEQFRETQSVEKDIPLSHLDLTKMWSVLGRYLLTTVHDCLNINFPVRWIGRAGPIVWPPCSPDFVPLMNSKHGSLQQLQIL
jgi:hypothetical protein